MFLILFTLSGCGGGGGGIAENAFNHFQVPEFCGDNIIQSTEQCDDGNSNNNDGCSATCRLEFSKIYAGGLQSCVLTTAGSVKCWGSNAYGQLGDGTTTDRSVPVDVSGLTEGVVELSIGTGHTCAVTTTGGAKCWGYNFFGQLGNGSDMSSSVPVDVTGLTSGVKAISVMEGHSCAVLITGEMKCWGWNNYGQLGNGTITSSSVPVNVSGLSSGVTAISTGTGHTCAVTATGGVKCWGDNSYQQLGDGTTTLRTLPVEVSGLSSGITAVSAGYHHTCALTTSSGLKCWGSNASGKLGAETNSSLSPPVDVSGLTSGMFSITAGGNHTCALTNEGVAKCWGRNGFGQLGDGTKQDRFAPGDVSGLLNEVKSISAGEIHTCVLSNDNNLKCWGNNEMGQLGDGTKTNSTVAVNVIGF